MKERKMNDINRRDFITKSVIAGTGLVLSGTLLASCNSEKRKNTDDNNSDTKKRI